MFMDDIKKIINLKKNLIFFGAVVQLVRILACHARGRGFESRPHRILYLILFYLIAINYLTKKILISFSYYSLFFFFNVHVI